MGCNVVCPYLPGKYEEDRGLDDPTGKSDEEFRNIINSVEDRIKNLKTKLENQQIFQ